VDDVMRALEQLQEMPRREGESALPEIGAILALIGAAAVARRNREACAVDQEYIVWRCAACKGTVAGFYPKGGEPTVARHCQRQLQGIGAQKGQLCGGNLEIAHRTALERETPREGEAA
jgi:hypothetical protein